MVPPLSRPMISVEKVSTRTCAVIGVKVMPCVYEVEVVTPSLCAKASPPVIANRSAPAGAAERKPPPRRPYDRRAARDRAASFRLYLISPPPTRQTHPVQRYPEPARFVAHPPGTANPTQIGDRSAYPNR